MNQVMNVRGQYEMHPDAETLSAFTEQALNLKERREVVAHLAVCGRCRQVVALAREAAGAEVAAARHGVAQPRAWWRSWGLAMVPAAALAATTVIAFYVHEHAAQRTAEVARLEQQQASEKAATPPQAQAAPPAPVALVKPNAKEPNSKRANVRRDEPERAAKKREQDTVEFIDPFVSQDAPISTVAQERQLSRALDGPAGSGAVPQIAELDKERKTQAEQAAEERHQYAAKAASPSSSHDSGIDNADNGGNGSADSRTAQSSEHVEVDAQQLVAQPAPDVNSGELKSLRLSGFSGGHMARPIHLPSGLPALSIASSDRRVLAIDKKGTLFFSEDSGLAWEKVKRQWTGRAILVRRKTAEDAAPPAATVPESAGSTSVSEALSHPETVFELVNDQSELWLSADGRIWTAE